MNIITNKEIIDTFLKKSPSSIFYSLYKKIIIVAYLICTMIYLIVYYKITSNSIISIVYLLVCIIAYIVITLIAHFKEFKNIKFRNHKIERRKKDIFFCEKLLNDNHVIDKIDIIIKYIDNTYAKNYDIDFISIFISMLVTSSSNDILYKIIIFIFVYFIIQLVFSINKLFNANYVSKQKYEDIKYFKSILYDILLNSK